TALPIPKLFPKDAGRYVTAGVWVAERGGVRNLSFHRIQVLDRNRGACRIVPRHLRHMYNEAIAAGEELKVAICVGLDPWNLLAGGTSVEYGVDESRIASALTQSCLGRPVDMVRARNGITIPAEADYVLEGRLTGETHDEGPCVDAGRTYDRVRKAPVLVVEGVSQRQDPLCHIAVGDEDINVFDDRDVEWAIATRFQADRGLVVLHDVRGSSIDPSGRDGFTSKMGIDATKPLGGDPAMFDKATL